MSVQRLVPLHAVALSSDPITGRIGDIYYNTSDNKLKFYNGSTWEFAGGVISGILDHIHTYDGTIFSVESTEIPNPGIVDGGTP